MRVNHFCEFATAQEAVAYVQTQSGMNAIALFGRRLVVPKEIVDRLEVAGVEFAVLHDYHGQVVSVPVND